MSSRYRRGLAVLVVFGALLVAGGAFLLARPPSDGPGSIVYIGRDVSDDDQVFVLTEPDGRVRQLTHDPGTKASPRWSPDGRMIAFVYLLDRIAVMDPDGGDLHTFTAPGVMSLSWSPDGNRFVYQSSAQGNDLGSFQFRVVNRDGSDDHPIPVSGQAPAWSPEGSWLAYSGADGGIWVARVDGTGARQVTHPKTDQQDNQPQWSPNEHDITFSRDGQIYTVPVRGASARLVYAKRGAEASNPTYIGEQALLFDQCVTGSGTVGGIYRVGTNGRGLALVTSNGYACTAAAADWTRTRG